MSAVYDRWERLVQAVLSREDLRRSGMRTPSETSSLAARSSFSSISSFDYSAKFSSFTYDQILRATDSLSSSKLIFCGVSGDFYHGVLEEGGVPVLVKKVYSEKLSILKSEMGFFAKVSHPKFVPLVGYCMENLDHKFVVYEYMENGDLFSSLYDNRGIAIDWICRQKVAIGVAQALCHLHHECVPPLVHRNVQASSILMDENFDGHLGRVFEVCKEEKNRKPSMVSKLFRLSRTSEPGSSCAPNATCAYDVYCFGKVLLELVTGKVGISASSDATMKIWLEQTLPFISIYYRDLVTRIIDPSLIIDEDVLEEVWSMAIVARACLNPKPARRPLMRHILEGLENPLKVVREE